MKKKPFALLSCLLVFSAGCSKEPASDQNSNAADTESMLVIGSYSAEADGDRVHSLEELYEAVDFVGEFKIKETTAAIIDNTDRIFTESTPEMLKVYKGEYNGQQILTCGGYMRVADYATQSYYGFDTSGYTKEELENGFIHYDWMNSYVPQEGDTLIIFGYYDDDKNAIRCRYDGQTLYLCSGDSISITSLECTDNFTEPLALDLRDNYNGTIEQNDDGTASVICSREAFTAALQ